MGRERLQWWVHPLYGLSSSIPLPWLLSFPPKAFPAANFLTPVPLTHLLQSTAVFPQNCSPVSTLQLPATLHTSGHVSLSRVGRALARKVCVVLTLFRLSQISCLTLRQPQMLLFHPNQLHQMQESLPSSSSPTPGHRYVHAGSPPPSPFLLLSYPIMHRFI